MYERMWYVKAPEVHLNHIYEYMNAHVPFVTYVWRTWETICIYFVVMIICEVYQLLVVCSLP